MDRVAWRGMGESNTRVIDSFPRATATNYGKLGGLSQEECILSQF